jgi:hypothetical protein
VISHQGHVFIAPHNCGSSVGYRLAISEYTPKDKPMRYSLDGTVVLTDCSHQIEWSFNDEDNMDKLDAAIDMLKEFRKKLVETTKTVEKLNK